MIDILTLTYAKVALVDRISKCSSDEIKFNMIKGGSKRGAVVTRFNINETSFCFINAHLSSGKDHISHRLSDIKKIFKDGFQKDKLNQIKDVKVEQSDQIYLFGNLNFRLALPDSNVRLVLEEYRQKLEKGDKKQAVHFLNQLLKTDQLMNLQTNKTPLYGFLEGTVTFPPTYKLVANSGEYVENHETTPAW